ncbi:MAG: hypothetical protein ABW321_11735, partial [Polyangiales bacterium]
SPDGAAGSGDGQRCVDGMISTLGSPDDPCSQAASSTSAECAATGGRIVAMCTDGSWGVCICVPGPATPSTCGNGYLDSGEDCDGSVPPGKSCAALMPGSSGLLSCTKACTFDTSLCATPSP